MVWTTPRTWVAAEKPTAATFNLHVRDNLNYLNAREAVHVRREATATTSLTTSYATIAGLGSVDASSMRDGSNNDVTYGSGVFTVRYADTYTITGGVEIGALASGALMLTLTKNGTSTQLAEVTHSFVSGVALRGQIGCTLRLAANDTVQLRAKVTTGTATVAISPFSFVAVTSPGS